jgi:very-short-patch-repair endonuclease
MKELKRIKKSTIEKIRATLEAEEYTFISSFNDGRGIRFQSICPNGHDYEAYWWSFHGEGKRCRQCYSKKRKPATDYVKQRFIKAGLIPQFLEYRDAKTKLPYQCKKCGFEHQINWNKFRQGCRCPRCGIRKSATKRALEYCDVKRFVESKDYTVLSKEYRSARQKLLLKCSKGHRCCITWNKFKGGHRCRKCSKVKSAKSRRIAFGQIMRSIQVAGYKIVDIRQIENRKDAKNRFTLKCPEGHKFDTCWNYWQRGVRCPYCLNKSEHRLGEILEELFPNKIKKQGNLGFLGRQRVDYYIEEEKIAIEYDGQQHYKPIIGLYGCKTLKEAQEQLRETQQRDKRKEQLCKERGWKIVRIRYDEPLTVKHLEGRLGR